MAKTKQRAEGAKDTKSPIKKAARTDRRPGLSAELTEMPSDPTPSDAWEAARIRYAKAAEKAGEGNWFTPPGEEYVDVQTRHPDKTNWSQQCEKVQERLAAIHREENGLPSTPWAVGWRWEFKTNDHRWYPNKAITQVEVDGMPKKWGSKTAGLTSPVAEALLDELMRRD